VAKRSNAIDYEGLAVDASELKNFLEEHVSEENTWRQSE
jgi:hypothetical protein